MLKSLPKPGDRVVHTKTQGRIRGKVVRVLVEVDVDGLDRMNPMPYDAENLELEEKPA